MENKVTYRGLIVLILGSVFITLKLTNIITWRWWWVLSPFWISGIIFIIIASITIIAMFMVKDKK